MAQWKSWQHGGYGSGEVHLAVGETRITAARGEEAVLSVPAGRELLSAAVWFGDKEPSQRFLLDVEDGHTYAVGPDPCCFFQISDDDPRLTKLSRCLPAESECPAGLVGINRFSDDATCGPRKTTCAPPTLLRIRGGKVQLAVDGREPERFGADYRRIALYRATPTELRVTLADGKAFSLLVLFRPAARYTLILDDVPHIVRDR
jgi:hypothetical protein